MFDVYFADTSSCGSLIRRVETLEEAKNLREEIMRDGAEFEDNGVIIKISPRGIFRVHIREVDMPQADDAFKHVPEGRCR